MDPLSPLVILFALPEETSPFLKKMRLRWPKGSAGPNALFSSNSADQPLLVCCSGAGMAAAARAARTALQSQTSASLLVICGFAGGLDPTLAPGSLILADTVLNAITGDILTSNTAFLESAGSVPHMGGILVHKGCLATADRVLVRSSEKLEFHRKYGALAVDMETAGAAAVADDAGVPWISVRAITDGCNDDMPLDFNAMAGPDGAIDRRKIIGALLKRPGAIPGLIRLGARSSNAAHALAAYLDALVTRSGATIIAK